MGANQSTNAPRMLDKHSARRKHRAAFRRAVVAWRQKHAAPREHDRALEESNNDEERMTQKVFVSVRKRPLFDYEKEQREFDVVTALESEDGHRVAVHDFRMASDMQTLKEQHSTFPFDAVFDETCSSEVVYDGSTCRRLVEDMCQGTISVGTLLLFGQTGSGKTYTNTAFMRLAAQTLESAGKFPVFVSCFEIGLVCNDLLEPSRSIKLLEKDGVVSPYNAAVVQCNDVSALVDVLRLAQRSRLSRSTKSNPDGSSRTHGIYQLSLGDGDQRLTFVDLAGSEMRNDSSLHDADLRQQCAAINTSLMCLKDCIRLKAQQSSAKERQSRIPYRNSKLTMLLRDCFTLQCARLLVIVTISPIAGNTEHSINTLRHGTLLCSSDRNVETGELQRITEDPSMAQKTSSKNSEQHPDRWNHEQFKHWLCRLQKGKLASFRDKMSPSIDGKKMSRAGVVLVAQWLDGDRVSAQYVIDAFRRAKVRYREKVDRERRARVAAS